MADDWRSLPRHRKPKYTSQDIRAKVVELRDALIANLDFIEEVISDDLYELKKYREKFGDLKYRPVIQPGSDSIEPTFGAPTQMNLEPLASQYRATINSLLQSVRLIQDEILPEDDAEGGSSIPSGDVEETKSRRASLRDTFKSEAQADKSPIAPKDISDEEDESARANIPTKLVENENKPSKAPNKAKAALEQTSEPKANPSTPRPWRDTTPRAQEPKATVIPKASPIDNQSDTESNSNNPPVVKEPKRDEIQKKLNTGEVGLSPALRLALRGGNRLDSIRDKYRDGESRVIGKASSVKRDSEDDGGSD